jgi:proteic killer suppression protein
MITRSRKNSRDIFTWVSVGQDLDAPAIPATTVALDVCIVMRYAIRVIRTFRHKGIERFFRTGSKAGIQPKHAQRLRTQLFALDNAKSEGDMSAPGWRLHSLKGDLEGHWSVDVSGNWRLTFAFEGTDAVLVDYRDYH